MLQKTRQSDKNSFHVFSESLVQDSIGRQSPLQTCRSRWPKKYDVQTIRLGCERAQLRKHTTAFFGGTILVPRLWFELVPRLVRIAINSENVTMAASR